MLFFVINFLNWDVLIIHDISTSLNGIIIFINDHIITEDSYSCCIFVNPNVSQQLEQEKTYWSEMIRHSNS